MTEFVVTEDHLKLAQRMYWDWDDGAYDGAPAVGLKRPYGNSDVIGDVVEILDLPTVKDRWNEESFTDEVEEQAMKIHREMETVMQIATATLSFKPGRYHKMEKYDSRSWRLVDDVRESD